MSVMQADDELGPPLADLDADLDSADYLFGLFERPEDSRWSLQPDGSCVFDLDASASVERCGRSHMALRVRLGETDLLHRGVVCAVYTDVPEALRLQLVAALAAIHAIQPGTDGADEDSSHKVVAQPCAPAKL